MALDELKDNDEVYDIDGFRYIVNKDFLEQVTPIKIDFTPLGFKIHSNMDFSAGIGAGAGCKGCGTTSSC